MTRVTKEAYTSLYGASAWAEYIGKRKITLEKYINLYGEVDGTERYNKWKTNSAKNKTLAGYIERYGEVDGPKLYSEKNKKLSVSVDALAANGKTTEQIEEIRKTHSRKSAMSLDRCINNYGKIDGPVKYNTWLESSRLRSHWTIDYWVSKGATRQEAKCIISEIQNTSSLDKFITRYGAEIGKEKYIDVNARKTKNFANTPAAVSKLETIFFDNLSRITEVSDKGRTCRLITANKTYYCDYMDVRTNKIIEIYGYFWHMRNTRYTGEDINCVTKRTAQETWDADGTRVLNLKNAGYEVLILWEDDITEDLDKQLLIAKTFLENK